MSLDNNLVDQDVNSCLVAKVWYKKFMFQDSPFTIICTHVHALYNFTEVSIDNLEQNKDQEQ